MSLEGRVRSSLQDKLEILYCLSCLRNQICHNSFVYLAGNSSAHNATMNAIVPVGPRPSGDFMPSMPKVVVLMLKLRRKLHSNLVFNRSVQESFGGDPRFEAEQMAYRPTNPRTLGQAPQVKITLLQRSRL